MARPTKYTDEIQALAEAYIDLWESQGDAIPSVEGLCQWIGIAKSTVYEWAKDEDKGEFSDTLEHIQEKQARVLINKGLTSEFNAAIAKLALMNHGYSDKKELTGADGKDLIPDSINVTYE